jgi:hypothetical protein
MVKKLLLTLLTPLRGAVRLLLALLILFEEWGWEPLARAMVWVGRLPLIRHLEAAVQRLSPYAALSAFLLPTLALLPVKLLALWLIGNGRAGLGLLVIVLAKLVGTAIVARLFQLTRSALLQLDWFAHWYGRWAGWKADLLAWVHASSVWRWARAMRLAIRRALRRFRLRG